MVLDHSTPFFLLNLIAIHAGVAQIFQMDRMAVNNESSLLFCPSCFVCVCSVFWFFFCGAALHLPATFITVLEQLAGVANLPPTQHRRPPSQHAAGHLPQPS